MSKQILKLVSGNDDKHVVVKWNVKPSEEKSLHRKVQIDVPPNDYNWKKNLKNSTDRNWVQKIGLK